MGGALAHILWSGGVALTPCPACGEPHHWEGSDLSAGDEDTQPRTEGEGGREFPVKASLA